MLPDKITAKVDKPIAQHKISNQIAKGKAILELIIETEDHYNTAKQKNDNWMKNTKCLLLEVINEIAVVQEFPLFLWSDSYDPDNFYEETNDFREALSKGIQYLEMILSRIE